MLSSVLLTLVLSAVSCALPTLEAEILPPKVASAWFAGWHATQGFSVQDIPWKSYTHLTYAFAETTPDVGVLSLEGSNPEVLPSFVSEAHKHGTKVLVSIGGWTGSRYWSSNIGSVKNRTTFVNTLMTFVNEHQLDGLDFDWEYPGKQGIGCNSISDKDATNYLLFLQELRQHPVGKHITLSAAVSTVPFAGPDGNPLADLSAFGQLLDWIAIMNYDIWGPWSPSVGPNAPLDDKCASADKQAGSARSAVEAWADTGFPHSKIVLGVPAYGHSFKVYSKDAFQDGSSSKLVAYPPFDPENSPAGDAWDDAAGLDVCGVYQEPGGNVDFWGLIQGGYLDVHGKPVDGMAYRYDECSQTPYIYNNATEIMVSFDNAKSFRAKGHFISEQKLLGFSMWEAGGDYNKILLKSIRKAAGYNM